MDKINIIILDASTLGDVSFSCIEELGNVISYETTNQEELEARIENAEVVITNKVVMDKKALNSAKNLKLICIAATGMNNVDLEHTKTQNIMVKNVVNYSTKSVATHTFSMLFYLLCSSGYYDKYIKNGEYEKSPIFTHLAHEFDELSSKTWGIVGLGNIGKEVAKIATAFGCKVLYYSTSGKNTNRTYDRVALKDLLAKSDIVSIHSPLNEQTKNLIGKNELLKMKENSFLLNLGRGGIVNEKDLAEILEHKKIFVALDVLEQEPLASSSAIKKISNLPNVYITPHIAWASRQARKTLVEKIASNIKSLIS